MHVLRIKKTVKKHPLTSPLPVKPHTQKLAISLKINPPKRYVSKNLSKRAEDRLYRISFVDTSDRDIILQQKLVNITVESENKN